MVRQVLQRLRRIFQSIWRYFNRRRRVKHPSSSRRDRSTISWVIPGQLALGGLPQPGDGLRLALSNIKVVLSLCAEVEGRLPPDIAQDKKFVCLRHVLPDRHYTTQLNVRQLALAVDLVHQCIERQVPVYVHCLAGIERSPTVCMAYLCRYHNLELWEAANWVKQVHPDSMPNESQIRTIREFRELCLKHPSQRGVPLK